MKTATTLFEYDKEIKKNQQRKTTSRKKSKKEHLICYTNNANDMGRMLKSVSMHKRDSLGTTKFNFIISCLTFRGLIPTIVVYK